MVSPSTNPIIKDRVIERPILKMLHYIPVQMVPRKLRCDRTTGFIMVGSTTRHKKTHITPQHEITTSFIMVDYTTQYNYTHGTPNAGP